MRVGIRHGLWLVVLLGSGCFGGKRFAPDLLPETEARKDHPPDGNIVLRETRSRTEKKLRVAYLKAAPTIEWGLLALVVALQPYGSFNTVTTGRGCAPVPCSLLQLRMP